MTHPKEHACLLREALWHMQSSRGANGTPLRNLVNSCKLYKCRHAVRAKAQGSGAEPHES